MPNDAPDDLASFDLAFLVAGKEELEHITSAVFSADELHGQRKLGLALPKLEPGALAFESAHASCVVTRVAEGGDPARALLELARAGPRLLIVLGIGAPLREQLHPGDVVVGDVALELAEVDGALEERWRLALESGWIVHDFLQTEAYAAWRTRPDDAPPRWLYEGWVVAASAERASALGTWFEARGNPLAGVSTPLVRALELLGADTRVAVVLGVAGEDAFAGVWALAAALLRDPRWWHEPAPTSAPAVAEPPAERETEDAPPKPPAPAPSTPSWIRWAIQAAVVIVVALGFFWFGKYKTDRVAETTEKLSVVDVEEGINVCLAIAKRGYVTTDYLAGVNWSDKAGVLQRISDETEISVSESDPEVVIAMAKICAQKYAKSSQEIAQVAIEPAIDGARVRLHQTGDECKIENGRCRNGLRVLGILDNSDEVQLQVMVAGQNVGEPKTLSVASLKEKGAMLNIGKKCELVIRDEDDKHMRGADFRRIKVTVEGVRHDVNLGETLEFLCTDEEWGKSATIDATLDDRQVRTWTKPLADQITLDLGAGQQLCVIEFIDTRGYPATVANTRVSFNREVDERGLVEATLSGPGEWTIRCPQRAGAEGKIHYEHNGKAQDPKLATFDGHIISIELGTTNKDNPPPPLKQCSEQVTRALLRSNCRVGSKLEIFEGVVHYKNGPKLDFPPLSGRPTCKTGCPR